MKNKKLTYFLLPLVILIWGIIIYKIIINLKGNNDDFIVNPVKTQNSPSFLPPDTFNLISNYRDPFLGNMADNFSDGNDISMSDNNDYIIIDPSEGIPWPKFVYCGIIKNNEVNKEVIIVRINGKEYLMTVNDIIENVKLVKVFKDSIKVTFNKESKYIRK
jgi:hypothetical protein